MKSTIEGDDQKPCPVCRKPFGVTAFRNGGSPMISHIARKSVHGDQDHKQWAIQHGFRWEFLWRVDAAKETQTRA